MGPKVSDHFNALHTHFNILWTNSLFTLLFIHLIFKKEFLFSNRMYISLTQVNCEFSKRIWEIFEFSQIYSFLDFLKSETNEDLIYGLQPLSDGVGQKISVVFKRHWHCATFFTFSKPVDVMIYLGKRKPNANFQFL